MSHKNHIVPVNDGDEEMSYGAWKVTKGDSAKHREKKTKLIIQEKQEKADKFDAFYKRLGAKCKQEEKRIDYVLVYRNVNEKDIDDEDDRQDFTRQNDLREKFENAMVEEGLQKQKIKIDDKVYTKLHCPFRRLCEEAELVSLEMPLAGVCIDSLSLFLI